MRLTLTPTASSQAAGPGVRAFLSSTAGPWAVVNTNTREAQVDADEWLLDPWAIEAGKAPNHDNVNYFPRKQSGLWLELMHCWATEASAGGTTSDVLIAPTTSPIITVFGRGGAPALGDDGPLSNHLDDIDLKSSLEQDIERMWSACPLRNDDTTVQITLPSTPLFANNAELAAGSSDNPRFIEAIFCRSIFVYCAGAHGVLVTVSTAADWPVDPTTSNPVILGRWVC